MFRLPRPGLRVTLATVVAGLAGLSLWAIGHGRDAAREVPLSPVTADWFVGPDFVDRAGLTTGESVAGELNDLSTLASDTFDPEAVDPAVREFYERTGEYRLRYRTTWYPPFRTGAALATWFTRRIQQLDLPGPHDQMWHELESRFVSVEEPTDDRRSAGQVVREDVRAWIRTDPATDGAVFVALYATHQRDGERLVNIAAPLPGGNVSTVLRPALLDASADHTTGIRLTTDGGGETGLYLQTPVGPVKLPAGQEFRVWRDPDGGLGAVHEMWLLGRRFLTVDYELTVVESTPDGTTAETRREESETWTADTATETQESVSEGTGTRVGNG